VSDRSFVRFGGLAGILIALTSWLAVVTYYTTANGGTDVVGVQIFHFLYALTAFWALFGIVAVYWVTRPEGEAWAFFAVVVGLIASADTINASLYQLAGVRAAVLDPSIAVFASPTNPLSVMTFGLTGLWFLIANLLLWRMRVPRLLVLLGFVAVGDLFAGFLGALSAQDSLVTLAAVVAGAVGGPLYWLWLGITLRRMA
jgi:hypothetical protein